MRMPMSKPPAGVVLLSESHIGVRLMREVDGRVIVAVVGEVDHTTADPLYEEALKLLEPTAGHLVLDFSRVGFCDSSGISALVGIMRAVRARQGSVVVAAAPDRVSRALHQVGLQHFIPIKASVGEALAHPPA